MVRPTRVFPWLFAIVIVILAVAGITSEVSAQVFRGTLTSPEFSGLVVDVTVTLQPGGPAIIARSFRGRPIDIGILVASVSGSFVSGFVQATNPRPSNQCFFTGTYDGTTVILNLDPISCGGPGTITLTRVA